jgi:serine/threonine protein kinase
MGSPGSRVGLQRTGALMATNGSSQEQRRQVHVGKYRILAHIASGGMGAVYRALDPESGREVALKVLPADVVAGKPALLERFRREAQTGARLCHENIVRLYEFGEAGGTCFLAMELIDGTNLQDLITDNGPLEPGEACRLLTQVARGLEHAWQKGIVHRDIKPANILLDRKEGPAIAKLADLGLARVSRDEEFRVTREGCTVGTVDYISPEQARDSAVADVRSDIYSLGCTFYHALTGRPPFNEGTLTERIVKHFEAEPPSIRQLNPAVPAGLAAVLHKMLAKKPQDRYQTPAELLADLRTALRPDPPPPVVASTPEAETSTTVPSAPSAEDTPASRVHDITAGQIAWAKEQVARGNHDYGIELLLTCCRLDPGNLACHRALRHALRAHQEERPSTGWLTRLKGLAAKVRLHLARNSHSHFRVLAVGEEVLARLPEDLSAQLAMAESAEELGLDELALWLLQKARKHRESEPQVNRALGRHYERQQQYEQALPYWEKAARACPTDSEARRKVRDLAALLALARARKPQG